MISKYVIIFLVLAIGLQFFEVEADKNVQSSKLKEAVKKMKRDTSAASSGLRAPQTPSRSKRDTSNTNWRAKRDTLNLQASFTPDQLSLLNDLLTTLQSTASREKRSVPVRGSQPLKNPNPNMLQNSANWLMLQRMNEGGSPLQSANNDHLQSAAHDPLSSSSDTGSQ